MIRIKLVFGLTMFPLRRWLLADVAIVTGRWRRPWGGPSRRTMYARRRGKTAAPSTGRLAPYRKRFPDGIGKKTKGGKRRKRKGLRRRVVAFHHHQRCATRENVRRRVPRCLLVFSFSSGRIRSVVRRTWLVRESHTRPARWLTDSRIRRMRPPWKRKWREKKRKGYDSLGWLDYADRWRQTLAVRPP